MAVLNEERMSFSLSLDASAHFEVHFVFSFETNADFSKVKSRTSAAALLRSSLSWDVARRRLVGHRRLRSSSFLWSWILEDGTDALSRNVGDCQHSRGTCLTQERRSVKGKSAREASEQRWLVGFD